MKIIVAIKQVPARETVLRVRPDQKGLDESGLSYVPNEPDTYALEAGLQLREALGGEVIALTAGPDRAAQTLREALARGADRGIHLRLSDANLQDPFITARHLAHVTRLESPDLFLTGLQSEDACYGETAVIVAELLGFSHATIVTAVQPSEGSIRVQRELEDGWHQFVSLPLPAALSIQSGSKRPRLASLLGIKQARHKPLQVVEAPVSGVDSSAWTLEQISAPVRATKATILKGDARECACRLVAHLRAHHRLL